MSPNLTESVAEAEALRYFEELKYSVLVAQRNETGPDRESLGEVCLLYTSDAADE